jgi:putative membrane protein
MMNGSWDGGWWALVMMLMSLAFIALIVLGVVFVVRSSSREQQPPQRPERSRALDLLDERFARSEINQTEYEERRRVLLDGT